MTITGYVLIGAPVLLVGIAMGVTFFDSDEHDVWWTPEWWKRWRETHKLALGRRRKHRDVIGRRESDPTWRRVRATIDVVR